MTTRALNAAVPLAQRYRGRSALLAAAARALRAELHLGEYAMLAFAIAMANSEASAETEAWLTAELAGVQDLARLLVVAEAVATAPVPLDSGPNWIPFERRQLPSGGTREAAVARLRQVATCLDRRDDAYAWYASAGNSLVNALGPVSQGDPDVDRLFGDLLAGCAPGHVSSAVLAWLGRRDDDSAVPALAEMAVRGVPGVDRGARDAHASARVSARCDAVDALGRHTSPSRREALLGILRAPGQPLPVRASALRGMARYGDDPAIQDLLEDVVDDTAVPFIERTVALETLLAKPSASRGLAAGRRLLAATHDPAGRWTIVVGLERLSESHPDELVRILESLVTPAECEEVRQAALTFLVKLGNGAALAALERLRPEWGAVPSVKPFFDRASAMARSG